MAQVSRPSSFEAYRYRIRPLESISKVAAVLLEGYIGVEAGPLRNRQTTIQGGILADESR